MMTLQEENYKVEERAAKAVEKHGTVKKAIKHLKAELDECESLWSKCLGHAITCNTLLISWLERDMYNAKN